jgi:hypothetical protein
MKLIDNMAEKVYIATCAKNQESFAEFLARAEPVDKDFNIKSKIVSTGDCKGTDGDE